MYTKSRAPTVGVCAASIPAPAWHSTQIVFAGPALPNPLNPSSVSRAIGDLESALGYRVFERRGRSLQLNPNGQRRLDVVRVAMRRVDDGVAKEVGLTGRVRVASDGPFLTAGVPALVRCVREQDPGIVLSAQRAVTPELEKAAPHGGADVGFGGAHRPARGLASFRLGEFETGLHVGLDHPLASGGPREAAELDIVEIRGAPTAASLESVGLHPRAVAMVDDPAVAVGICRALGAASILPERLVELLGGGRLVRLGLETPPVPVHLVSREDMGGTPRIKAVVGTAIGLASAADTRPV